MSQPSVASYFNTRKRKTVESTIPNKKIKIGHPSAADGLIKQIACPRSAVAPENKSSTTTTIDFHSPIKRICTTGCKASIEHERLAIKVGSRRVNEKSKSIETQPPVQSAAKHNLSVEDVKQKLLKSRKLSELKASLQNFNELARKRDQLQHKNEHSPRGKSTTVVTSGSQLKKFNAIEFEVLTSPQKGLKTPTKTASPLKGVGKSLLFNSRRTLLQDDPTENGETEEAHSKYHSLVNFKSSNLQLPYKYRRLEEVFKCVDAVCLMLYKRKEVITLNRLKPAVQRMLRKNFDESHLAMIRSLYPEAFDFVQVKMRNFGSTSKDDYYQLVINPHFKWMDTSRQPDSMDINQSVTERQQHFQRILLDKVRDAHDKFLKSLDPPLTIPKESVTRWHPDFDLEGCPDIEKAFLPQPPNILKFASAKHILATARNLFTPNDEPIAESIASSTEEHQKDITDTVLADKPNPVASILKTVPKSLLDKIRAKQTQNIVKTVTRTPQRNNELSFERLSQLALHLRNIFISEKKNVLPLNIVISKLAYSFQMKFTHAEIETLLKSMSDAFSNWMQIIQIRKNSYIKINKKEDLHKIINGLESVGAK